MKKFLFTAVLITIFCIAYSQKNYLPAYIIQNNGDTLKGFIDYRNWKKIPADFSFKSTMNDVTKVLKPGDIKEVSVNGEKYISQNVDIIEGPNFLDFLPLESTITIEKVKCFLLELSSGSKSLYYYENQNVRQQYYIKQGDSVVLLIYTKYIDKSGKADVIRENEKFKGQLAFYLVDCKTIQNQLEKTTYNKESLVDLFNHYYNCSNTKTSYQKTADKSHSKFGITAGTTLTTLDLESTDITFNPITAPEYSKSVNFTVGAYYDYVFLRNMEKWSFYNELAWHGYECVGYYNTYVSENEYSNSTNTMGLNYLKLTSMIRYKYPIKKASIFCNLGISNNYALSAGMKNYKETETMFYGRETTKVTPIFTDLRRYEFGLVIGIGARYKHFNIETRFEKGNGMSSNYAVKSTTYRYSMFLSYSF